MSVRVDDLLELLSTSVKHYFEYVADLQRCGRLKSLRSANQGTRERAEAMLQSGMESNVVWETNTTCIMPSQSLPNVSWRVNLLLYICDCPVSNISGGCKHMQVALCLASQKGVDVEAERKTYALGLLEGDAYVAAGDKIVIETDAWTSIYDTVAARCTCIAFSFGIDCICSILGRHIHEPREVEQLPETDSQVDLDAVKVTVSTQQMLQELSSWASSSSFTELPGLQTIVSKAHRRVFGQFTSVSTHKKIRPMHSYRPALVESLKELDHNYQGNSFPGKRHGVNRKTPMDFKPKSTRQTSFKKKRVMGVGPETMHELFAQVLRDRDLSKAGDLFLLSDADIEEDLSEVLHSIRKIASSKTYLENDNDQSVVEICITRVTSAIRETNSIERHSTALVLLLESCLLHKVAPASPDEPDPPHAKITSDVLSSIFMNYSERQVMEQALPVAVRFLQHCNCELNRNLVSYLSLAAIDNSSLLARQLHLILDNILIHKNRGLVRLLPQIFPENRGLIYDHIGNLIHLLPECDVGEKTSILQLTDMVAQSRPQVLVTYISLLCSCLHSTVSAALVLQTFTSMAATHAESFLSHMAKLKETAEQQMSTLSQVAKIYGAVGRISKSQAQESISYLLSQLPNSDNHTQPLLLKEVKVICEVYPSALGPYLSELLLYGQTGPIASRRIIHQLQDICSKSTYLPSSRKTVGSQTDGIVTVIKLGEGSERQNSAGNVTILGPGTSIPSSKSVSTSTREISAPSLQHLAEPGFTAKQPVAAHNQSLMTSRDMIVLQNLPHSRNPVVPQAHVVPSSAPLVTGHSRIHASESVLQYPSSVALGSTMLSQVPSSLSSRSSLLQNSQSIPLPPGQPSSSLALSSSQMSITSTTSRPQPVNPPPHHENIHYTLSLSHTNTSSSVISHTARQTNSQSYLSTKPAHSSQNPVVHTTRCSSSVNNRLPANTNTQNSPITKSTHAQPTSQVASPYNINAPTTSQITPPCSTKAPPTIIVTSPNLTLPVLSRPQTTTAISTTLIGAPAKFTSLPQSLPERPLSATVSTVVTSIATITRTTVAGSKVQGPMKGEVTERRPIPTISTTTTPTYLQAIPLRDAVQQFCEKHLSKIKACIDNMGAKLPFPIKATIEERKHKRMCRLHFICLGRSEQCLYNCHFFTMQTKNPRIWIHLIFLATQARSSRAVSQQDPSVGNLKATWDRLKTSSGNSFVRLVTSSFPTAKDQEVVLQELHNERYFDVFELNATEKHWACFICNHPEKTTDLLQEDGLPAIEGQLKEKKGRWKKFKRWKTRYFSLSGATITCSKTGARSETLPVNKIQSVKAVRKDIRDIPKAFEIFTQDESYVFKAKDSKHAEQWLQCIHIAVARSQNHEPEPVKAMSELDHMVQGWSNVNMGRVNQRARRGRLNDSQTKL